MGIEDRVKIRVEPGLFEFLGWYERGLPTFFNLSAAMINEDEEVNLYNIDKNYRPIISLEKLSRDEKYTDYYNRSFKVTQQITDKHKLTGKILRKTENVDRSFQQVKAMYDDIDICHNLAAGLTNCCFLLEKTSLIFRCFSIVLISYGK